MDEQENKPKKPVYRYEPGELDKTRKNLGFVEVDEAKKMLEEDEEQSLVIVFNEYFFKSIFASIIILISEFALIK